ncbi:MAG: pyruvate dehydrogenase complex dihydrolipoamide acetyltransferase [Rhodospirillaceae bacterium]|nr:pyruvate dehydrogenase complex dihydrolipoamide acetyltransferase [Rhodospirillaceae bacterium]
MPTPVLMPALSPTMTEGNLVKWNKKEGDRVKPGEVIAEIETDKATMEVESADSGVLGKILVPAGTNAVKVNTPIAILLAEGEKLENLPSAAAAASRVSPPQSLVTASSQSENTSKSDPVLKQQQVITKSNTASSSSISSPSEKVTASPLAKKMAEISGLDLNNIQGTGPNGRIVKIDIEKNLNKTPAVNNLLSPVSQASIYSPSSNAFVKEWFPTYKELPLSNMRKTIAKRLVESKREAPHFYLTIECELDSLIKLRQDLNNRLDKDKLSLNDFIIKAAAIALKLVPAANVAWAESYLRSYDHVDISVAIAIPGALIFPIIRRADQKPLLSISKEMKDLAQRAKDNKLKPEEYQGGTFSISNLGMYGIKNFAAVVNPPQAAILAIGAGEQRAVVKEGAIAIANMMTCTLSLDHRAVDGVIGSELLNAFKKTIQDPLSILL